MSDMWPERAPLQQAEAKRTLYHGSFTWKDSWTSKQVKEDTDQRQPDVSNPGGARARRLLTQPPRALTVWSSEAPYQGTVTKSPTFCYCHVHSLTHFNENSPKFHRVPNAIYFSLHNSVATWEWIFLTEPHFYFSAWALRAKISLPALLLAEYF